MIMFLAQKLWDKLDIKIVIFRVRGVCIDNLWSQNRRADHLEGSTVAITGAGVLAEGTDSRA